MRSTPSALICQTQGPKTCRISFTALACMLYVISASSLEVNLLGRIYLILYNMLLMYRICVRRLLSAR